MLLVRTKWAYVTWGIVNESVSDHLILALKTYPALSPGTAGMGAVMRTARGVYIGMTVTRVRYENVTMKLSTYEFRRYCD